MQTFERLRLVLGAWGYGRDKVQTKGEQLDLAVFYCFEERLGTSIRCLSAQRPYDARVREYIPYVAPECWGIFVLCASMFCGVDTIHTRLDVLQFEEAGEQPKIEYFMLVRRKGR